PGSIPRGSWTRRSAGSKRVRGSEVSAISAGVQMRWPCVLTRGTSPFRKAALGEVPQCPIIFSHQLIYHIPLFQIFGQNLPSVGLHFNMGAEARIFAQVVHDAKNVVRGVLEELAG